MTQEKFYSHFDDTTGRYQLNRDHLLETSGLAYGRSPSGFPPSLARTAALLHDCGKFSNEWAEYFSSNLDGNKQEKRDHATAGGAAAEMFLKNPNAAEMAAVAIYSHHGLRDCYSSEKRAFLVEERRKKSKELPTDECIRNLTEELGPDVISEAAGNADRETADLLKHIAEWTASFGAVHGSRHFWLGMYERLLFSLLIDADRRDTEDFINGVDKETETTDATELWEQCSLSVEKRLSGFTDKSGINKLRAEISELCLSAAKNDNGDGSGRFVLNVPTGAGKTLSSLRFAVEYAKKHKKRRIIYVAPYMSVTEQNADEIRRAVGREDIVLEHHSSVIIEDEDGQRRYDRVTEDWRVPIVVTTAVQFLDTLYSYKTGCVRRFASLCDSVIIIDEIQALPINVTELFCLAVNFLTEFAGAAVVLCSATQPCFDKVPENRILDSEKIIDSGRFADAFIRTEIHDDTGSTPRGMSFTDAAEYIISKAREHGDVLFISNTKGCALEVFRRVADLCGGEFDVYHLSTNMYPEHRRRVISELKSKGGNVKICISTQVVEAGVDISFGCVIRSLAGLDSIVQAAGRCNRSAERNIGHVYIVKMDDEAEMLDRLKDIRIARETATFVLDQYRRFGGAGERLDSERFINMYFSELYRKRKPELCYNVTVDGVRTSIVELLSRNRDLCPKNMHLLCQAFETAGREFNVIDDDDKIPVVVETAKSRLLIAEYDSDEIRTPSQKRAVLRKLSPYTVTVSEYTKKKLSSGLKVSRDGALLILDGRFYDGRTGVTDTPEPMEFLNI